MSYYSDTTVTLTAKDQRGMSSESSMSFSGCGVFLVRHRSVRMYPSCYARFANDNHFHTKIVNCRRSPYTNPTSQTPACCPSGSSYGGGTLLQLRLPILAEPPSLSSPERPSGLHPQIPMAPSSWTPLNPSGLVALLPQVVTAF